MYDTSAPTPLIQLQKWFGQIISRPLNEEGEAPIAEEAAHYIRPSKTLKPHERIALYNKQYWWRLIGCLHEAFPLTVRLYGYQIFNFEMAVPYLDRCPPNSWSLSHLGEGFADGLKEEKARAAATLDWAYHQSFVAKHFPSVREVGGDPMDWVDKPLALQPHLFLLNIPYPLLKVRKGILKEEPGHELPEIGEGLTLYAIYRDRQNHVSHKELDREEWEMLKMVEGEKPLAELPESEQLAFWVQDWILRDWLYGVA